VLEQRLKEIEQMTQGRREHLPTIEQSSV
jgi:hypothetical protein